MYLLVTNTYLPVSRLTHDAMKKQLLYCFSGKLWVCYLNALHTGASLRYAAAQTGEMQFPASAMKKPLLFFLTVFWMQAALHSADAQTVDIALPVSKYEFPQRSQVTVLTNGNFVYSNYNHSEPGRKNCGIVQLYNGKTLALISTLKGQYENDQIGQRVYALPNGNFVTSSEYCNSGNLSRVGAVTWVNGLTGLSGYVGSTNSLMGSSYMDQVSIGGVTVLANGNYVVGSYRWTNGTGTSLGAATWCSGSTGRVGYVSTANSLFGAWGNDLVGTTGNIVPLTNGNYVVVTKNWDNGPISDAGAVTLCNGATGTSGVLSTANSLVGANPNDQVGYGGVTPLANGNFVVCSPNWRNGSAATAGAATWVNGTTGLIGEVSTANSLVGAQANDQVGAVVTALTNGHYMVGSSYWKNGAAQMAGAATWGNGSTGITGVVSTANSLVGTHEFDFVGGRAVPLTNGNILVVSWSWGNGTTPTVGAITWCNGSGPTVGEVSASNSMTGTVAAERLGTAVALKNGNYVIVNPKWVNSNGDNLGAVVWADGTTGISGTITDAIAIVGRLNGDAIGSDGVFPLANGNYVIGSRDWDSGTLANAGAVTWMDGTKPASGMVTETNSLYSNAYGGTSVLNMLTPLPNGNYVVKSGNYLSPNVKGGAVTWGNGNGGSAGEINASNSLVGVPNDDFFRANIGASPDGNYTILNSGTYLNGRRVGSATWGNGATGTTGEFNDCNSVFGEVFNGGSSMSAVYNHINNYMVVPRPDDNLLTIYYPGGPYLGKTADNAAANIANGQSANVMNAGGCRIIASLTSSGASPVTGTVNAKVWVETAVPQFGSDPFVARHYEITPDNNAATATGRITLYFSQKEFTDFNAAPRSTRNLPVNANDASGKANLRIGKYAGTSSDGTGLPGSYGSILSTIIDPDDNDIVWNDTFKRWEVTFDTEGFSGFVIQTTTEPLPVRLVSFSAKPEGKTVKLDWQIADAVNFSHFEIERAPDAKQFGAFGKIDFEEGVDSYTLTDGHPLTSFDGQAYYRLKMVDADGSYAFSKILSVQLDGGNAAYVYPNPVVDRFIISLPAYEGKAGKMTLVNASGKVLHSEAFTVKNGEASMDFKKSLLEEGHYIIQLDLGGERRQFKIVRTR